MKRAELVPAAEVGHKVVTINSRVRIMDPDTGIITDRDIVVRALADGRSAYREPVWSVMSSKVLSCFEDQPVDKAASIMAEHGVRRLPVLGRNRRLTGLVSLSGLRGGASKRKPYPVTFFKELPDGKVKVGANILVFVYLLGKYCASSDEMAIQTGLQVVKDTLAENYIRPDEATKRQSLVKEKSHHTFIDKIKSRLTASLYWVEVTNFGHRYVHVPDRYVREFDRLLTGGIWAQLDLRLGMTRTPAEGIPSGSTDSFRSSSPRSTSTSTGGSELSSRPKSGSTSWSAA